MTAALLRVAPVEPVHGASTGDNDDMPERFRRDARRDAADEQQLLDAGPDERNALRLERVRDDIGDMRVAMTSLAGDVRSLVQRLERHDGDHAQGDAERAITGADLERRLRDLERRSWAVPSLSALLGVLSFALALWVAFGGRA